MWEATLELKLGLKMFWLAQKWGQTSGRGTPSGLIKGERRGAQKEVYKSNLGKEMYMGDRNYLYRRTRVYRERFIGRTQTGGERNHH